MSTPTRFSVLPADATPAQNMAHKLKTKAGRALYALRKRTVEPVFGIIKSVLGLSPVLLARFEESHKRVDARLPRMEFEAHGRIASAVAENAGNPASSSKVCRNSLVKTQFHQPGLLKSDRLLGP